MSVSSSLSGLRRKLDDNESGLKDLSPSAPMTPAIVEGAGVETFAIIHRIKN